MNINKKSRIYHTTSVDTAKSNTTTLSLAGQKRKYLDFREKQKDGDAPAPNDITTRADFHRPITHQDSSFRPLEAGRIRDVVDRGQSEYSQRRGLALTPTLTSNPLLDLSHPAYGLPKQLVNNFASVGIRSIYPWQCECLLKSGALEGTKNLVYTAPTGGGKSLIADILMLKKVIETPGKKALLVLPYVALVQEKMRWLRRVVEGITKTSVLPCPSEERPILWRKRGDEDSIRVMGFFGGSRSRTTWEDMDIAVCTIEKVVWLRKL